MENWGLITYRTTALLFDEKESDQRYKNRVAYVVAHELAHQWFGNLVTMDWWSEVRSLRSYVVMILIFLALAQ
jgi:aminopeptidase N